MGEVHKLYDVPDESVGRQERVYELLDRMSVVILKVPALAGETSVSALEVGAKVVRKLLSPRPPDIPWYTPYDTVEELRQKGLTDKEIGRRERFRRESHKKLNNITKVGG